MADTTNSLGGQLPGHVNAYEQIKKLLDNILSLEQKQSDLTAEETKLLADQLKSLETKVKLNNQSLDAEEEQLKTAKQFLAEQKRINQELNASLKLNNTILDKLNSSLKKGLGTNLVSDMTSVNQKMTESLKSGKSGLLALGSGAKAFGKEMLSAENLTSTMISGWTQVYTKFEEIDKAAVEFGKTTSMTRDQAWDTYRAFRAYSNESEKITDVAEDFLNINAAVNKQLGIGVTLTNQTLSQYAELTKLGKFDEETMQGLVVSSAAHNTELEESVKNRYRGFAAAQRQYGVAVNERALIKEMSKISANILINYQGQEQALAKAAAQAKIMGTDLTKLDNIANSLMDFEGSINKQMEAELLTGRTLNLERARYYALTNDLAGLQSELNAQGITAEKFGDMNRIQQEAIAGAMGMSKSEMAGMLIEQKAILQYGKDSYNDKKKQFLLDVESMGLAKATNKLGDDALATTLKQATNAELLELSQRKMGDSMGQLVELVKPISDFFTNMNTALASAVGAVKAIGTAFTYISGIRIVEWLMGGGIGGTLKSLTATISKLTGSATEGAASSITQSTTSSGGSSIASSATTPLRNAAGQFVGGSEIGVASSFQSVGEALSSGSILKRLAKGLIKVPFISAAIEGIFANSDIKGMIAEGKTGPDLKQEVGKRAYQAIGSVAGGTLGAGIATAASVSGVPTFLASALAASVGSMGGSYLAGKLSDVLGAQGMGELVLDTFYKGNQKEPALAEGGLVTQGGIAKVDTGEVYLGANSLQVLKDLVTETRQQNQYLQQLVKKDTTIVMDGAKVAGAVASNVVTSYGNILNPSSRTYA